ncbi:hypothetical protein BGX34_000248 [Mortierella sp. NVP85]|nr:hypothetical protein BGX34_000248 [Mortierella sp. NVP85]
MTALRSKFPVLKKLTVEVKSSMETSVVPEILASCPQLEQFTMHRVMSRDILLGKPWVCGHSMKRLHLNIIISSGQGRNRHQQHVLERISHLSNLETLTLEHNTRNGKDTHLLLQLGNGLEHLATLKKLRFLVLMCFTQEFTTAEVQIHSRVNRVTLLFMGNARLLVDDKQLDETEAYSRIYEP